MMWTFSADVPYDAPVYAYMRHRGDTRLPMNVSAEADAAYITEKGLKLGPTILKSWPIGICSRCHGVIRNAPYLSATGPGKFCSRECRDAGKTVVRRGRPRLTPKQQRESEANRRRYQRNLMRNRRASVLAKNSPQPIGNTSVTDAYFCDLNLAPVIFENHRPGASCPSTCRRRRLMSTVGTVGRFSRRFAHRRRSGELVG